jgi:hypothetical protein
MSFGLVVFDKAHLSKVHKFVNAIGVTTRPLDTVREISLDGDGVWELSRSLPRLSMESHASEDGCTYWFLELETSLRLERVLTILNGQADHVFRNLYVDEYIDGCKMRRVGMGPMKKKACFKDVAFWPKTSHEQFGMNQLIKGKLQKAA